MLFRRDRLARALRAHSPRARADTCAAEPKNPIRNARCARARVISCRAPMAASSPAARSKMPVSTNTSRPRAFARYSMACSSLRPRSRTRKLVDDWAGLRPGTPDNLPILGPTDIRGLYMATGHYRNGILLAPATAKMMSEWVLGRKRRTREWKYSRRCVSAQQNSARRKSPPRFPELDLMRKQCGLRTESCCVRVRDSTVPPKSTPAPAR